MATKKQLTNDWKKVNKDVWYNNDKMQYIKIYRDNSVEHITILSEWNEDAGGRVFKRKNFKTKQKALDYTKTYMRKY